MTIPCGAQLSDEISRRFLIELMIFSTGLTTLNDFESL